MLALQLFSIFKSLCIHELIALRDTKQTPSLFDYFCPLAKLIFTELMNSRHESRTNSLTYTNTDQTYQIVRIIQYLLNAPSDASVFSNRTQIG